jgi:broad specificity phosphatase PhoE
MPPQLWLIRHGETEWSLSGAHTGRTDLPLTQKGEDRARALRPVLATNDFALVLTSPLQRATRTCELAGFGDRAIVDPNLSEWNYGDYEGKSTDDIHRDRPDWDLFRDGVPNGEKIEQVADRARSIISRAVTASGDVALFAHGHILRILTATWLDLDPRAARLFALGTASISVLGYEHENRVISSWNLQTMK